MPDTLPLDPSMAPPAPQQGPPKAENNLITAENFQKGLESMGRLVLENVGPGADVKDYVDGLNKAMNSFSSGDIAGVGSGFAQMASGMVGFALTASGPVGAGVKGGAKLFSKEANDSIPTILNALKSRETFVSMSPREFLDLASQGFDKIKSDRVSKMIKEKKPFDSFPSLSVEMQKDGSAAAVSHEGRHRMRVLIKEGVGEVPVRITVREGGPAPAIRFSETDQRPTFFTPQEAATDPTIKVPFKAASSIGKEASADISSKFKDFILSNKGTVKEIVDNSKLITPQKETLTSFAQGKFIRRTSEFIRSKLPEPVILGEKPLSIEEAGKLISNVSDNFGFVDFKVPNINGEIITTATADALSKGYAVPRHTAILISSKLPLSQLVSVMSHEVGHSLIGIRDIARSKKSFQKVVGDVVFDTDSLKSLVANSIANKRSDDWASLGLKGKHSFEQVMQNFKEYTSPPSDLWDFKGDIPGLRYLVSNNELLADAFSQIATHPEVAKKEMPIFVDLLKRYLESNAVLKGRVGIKVLAPFLVAASALGISVPDNISKEETK